MWHWLCVLSRTINQRPSLSLKWNNSQILADSFVCRSVWTMRHHRIPVCLELAWQLWLETENVTELPLKKKIGVGRWKEHIYDPKVVPRHKKQAMHNEISAVRRKLEPWSADCSPVHTKHACFIITKGTLNINRGQSSVMLPHGEGSKGDSRFTPWCISNR